jgi:hypothetical protein
MLLILFLPLESVDRQASFVGNTPAQGLNSC